MPLGGVRAFPASLPHPAAEGGAKEKRPEELPVFNKSRQHHGNRYSNEVNPCRFLSFLLPVRSKDRPLVAFVMFLR